MTLKRKLIFCNLALLIGLAILATASLWGLDGLRQQLRTAVYLNNQLAMVAGAEVKLAEAQGELAAAGGAQTGRPQAVVALNEAIALLERFTSEGTAADVDTLGSYSQQKLAAVTVLARARAIRDGLARASAGTGASAAAGESPAAPPRAQTDSIRTELRSALQSLHQVVRECDGLERSTQEGSSRYLRTTLMVIGGLSALMLIGAIGLSVIQYRGVMLPLQRLRVRARQIAGGDFAQRCEPVGDKEFVELAQEFNQMGAELQELYRDLEHKVARTSKDLVRSERLASVGFLAAGVAHEINNPLSIISGYAELSLKRLRALGDDDAVAEAAQALQVIRDESFRCKEITEKLLSLSRPGDGHREIFSLIHVAEDVTAMVGALKNYRDRRVEMKLDRSEPLTVYGSPNEIKQVILNLTVNALEAVKPGVGEVSIDGHREDGWIELSVRDNGRGMSAEVIDRVFEPFFTAKRGTGTAGGAIAGESPAAPPRDRENVTAPTPGIREHGTGLGLSITHAIIQNHGGEIRAESDGPDRGSRFIVRLPMAPGENKSA